MNRPFELRGRVIRGEGIGRTIGFPTANLDRRYFSRHPVRPGVYFALALVGRLTVPSIAIIGVPWQRSPRRTKIELYFIGRRENFVGQYVRAQVLKRLRGLRTFKTDHALIVQIKLDLAAAKKYFGRKK